MRKQNSEKSTENGNALIYVIIAIALIGFLTVSLSNQANQSDGQNIDDELAELVALELIEYAQTAQQVIEQMEITGTSFTEFDFINPTSATYNTAPHIHKVYHPQGGGFNYKESDSFATGVFLSTTGWNFSNATNVEWTRSGATDLIFTALDINATVCATLNEKITGSTTIPTNTTTIALLFSEASAATELNTTNCAAGCEGYPSLCIEDSGGDYAYYNILINR